jgi:hypothetical protein
MKINEFHDPVDLKIPYDVVEDVVVFMRNDPQFYRKDFFPALSKVADLHRAGKPIDKNKCLSDMVERALEGYCKKFNVARMVDEVFTNEDREQIINKVFSEEMEEIQKGEYK